MTTRTALVTGANRGIGFATARQLAILGYRTIVAGRDAGRTELAASTLRADELDATSVAIDVTSDASVGGAARHVADRFGPLGGPDNRAAAPLTAEEAARTIVEAVLTAADRPSGQFVDADGAVRW